MNNNSNWQIAHQTLCTKNVVVGREGPWPLQYTMLTLSRLESGLDLYINKFSNVVNPQQDFWSCHLYITLPWIKKYRLLTIKMIGLFLFLWFSLPPIAWATEISLCSSFPVICFSYQYTTERRYCNYFHLVGSDSYWQLEAWSDRTQYRLMKTFGVKKLSSTVCLQQSVWVYVFLFGETD